LKNEKVVLTHTSIVVIIFTSLTKFANFIETLNLST